MRWVTGILLVCAAALKAVELINEPMAAMVNPLGRLFAPIQIGVELGLGLLALSGVYWDRLRRLLLVLFVGFAGYSLYLAMSGAASCGCFGSLPIHPWWTFFLDAAIVLGLVVSFSHGGREQSISSEDDCAPVRRFLAARRRIVTGAMGVSVIATALLVRYVDGRTAVAEGVFESVGGLEILEPERWIGERLPIAGFVDVDLTSGEWVVVLHRHDCPACRDAVPRYERLAATGCNIALIEVPPYGDAAPFESDCHYGRLKNDREWFVQTPVELRLLDGTVTAAKTNGH